MKTVNLAFSTGGIVSLLVAWVLPIVVGYFTKASLNSGLKAAILAALSGITAVLSQWLTAINDNQHFAWQAAVLTAFGTWVVAEATYFKIWKPTGLSDIVQAAGPIADPVEKAVVNAIGRHEAPDPVESATP